MVSFILAPPGCSFADQALTSAVYFSFRYMYRDGGRVPRPDFMSISLFFIGFTSFLYHASLRQTLQFADDLSMLVFSWALLEGIMSVRMPPDRAKVVGVLLGSAVCLFSAFYVYHGQIIYHTAAFTVLVVLIVARGYYLFYVVQPSFPETRLVKWKAQGRQALLAFVVGYVVWNIDLEYCLELREIRERIGFPWAFLLELHGWWHILTAISASRLMDIAKELREFVGSEEAAQ